MIGQAIPLAILAACLAVIAWSAKGGTVLSLCEYVIDRTLTWKNRPNRAMIDDVNLRMAAESREQTANLAVTEPPVPVPPGGFYRDEAALRTWYRAPTGCLYSWTDERLTSMTDAEFSQVEGFPLRISSHPYLPEGVGVVYDPEQMQQARGNVDIWPVEGTPEYDELLSELQRVAAVQWAAPLDTDYNDVEALIEEVHSLSVRPTTWETTDPVPHHWVNREHP